MTVFYDSPHADPTRLGVRPRLASWNAAGDPDQIRLAEFLDHAESAVASRMGQLEGPVALRLDVGLPATIDLLYHDLDNYLHPLVTRLGSSKFESVWATKTHRADSWICVDSSRAVAVGPQEHVHRVRTTRSAETVAWKQEVRAQLADATELPPGPVELQLAFGVGPGRNWANLWKPAIDSLGRLLGLDDPANEWSPRDGRVVRLGLHREVVPSLGHDVEIAILAAPHQDVG